MRSYLPVGRPSYPRLSARWQKRPCIGRSGSASPWRALPSPPAARGAGATVDSAAIGPSRTGAGAKNFAPFPVPASWVGQDNVTYKLVVKGKTGTAPREFGFIAKSSMVFWLNCIGTGSAHIASPAIGLKWGIAVR